jgi:alkylhydroperoxidase family enzyme
MHCEVMVYSCAMTNNNQPPGTAISFQRDVTADMVREREAVVIGDGPRIQPLPVDDLTADLLKIINRMVAVNSALGSREAETLTDLLSDHAAGVADDTVSAQLVNLPEILRTMLRHPDLFARQTDVGIELLSHGALSPRDRELAVLRIGWLCQAPYEWGEHVLIARRLGITTEEVERITCGSDAPGWSEHEQAIVRAVEELHRDAMISDATWATLAKGLDERQLIELPILVGQYQAVAYYQNSLRLRLHAGNLGLKAR